MVRCQHIGIVSGIISDINSIVAEVKAPDGRKVGQVAPQRHETIKTDAISAEAQLLDRNEACQMGRQRLDTDVADMIHAEVKMLDGNEEC